MKREYLNELPAGFKRSRNDLQKEIDEFYASDAPILKITLEKDDAYKNLSSMHAAYYNAVKSSKRKIRIRCWKDSIYLIKQLQADEKPSD